jgi:hypothetical protein
MVAQMITRRFPFIRRGRRKRGPYVRLFLARLDAFKSRFLAIR